MTDRVLHLIRHGRSDQSATTVIDTPRGRQWDPPLDEVGRDQARRLSVRLALLDPPPAAVYCSPLRRTRETAAPYVERTGIEVRYDDDLVEANVGEWEGLPFEEIIAIDEDVLPLVRASRAIWSRAPGGEAFDAFQGRVQRAIDAILEHHPEGDIVVICHGGVINAYLGPFLGIRHEMFFIPENTSVSSIELDERGPRVRFLNDILHLTDPQLFGDAPEG
ncbi:MAG: histidine phosphatase family protein [Actinomycetota bacterium]